MFAFIRQLFARRAPPQIVNEASAPPPAAATAVAARPAPALVLQREEIIDSATRIAGYRFAARRPELPDPTAARATLEALAANRIAAFAARRLALIPLQTEDWLNLDYRALIGPHTVFLLEWPQQPEQIESWCRVATAIRAAGARVAVAEGSSARQRELLATHADLLLIDFSAYALPDFERVVTALRQRQPQLVLLVANIDGWPERRYCVSLGVAYCMGSFTTCPDEEQTAGEIGPSRLVLIEMLNLLRREATAAEIAGIAKRDPGVSVKLLAMANSPLLGLAQPATGIDQAIMLVGREQLYRWLSIAVFRAAAASPRDDVLLELALNRGRFLELIGRCHHGKVECDELFLLGLLSLLDILFGVPIAAVVERLHLAPTMRDALLQGDGPLAPWLMLAIAVEKGRARNVARLAEQLAVPLADIETAAAAALAWAEEAASLKD